jgi:alanine-glyoxylate transaminase/serine-glyoxylate transaminase/serine-pyruvate transaminase
MMQRLGLDVHVIDQTWGEGADEAKLDEVLRSDKEKKIKAVCVVHNETSTGVTSDIAHVRKVTAHAGPQAFQKRHRAQHAFPNAIISPTPLVGIPW